MTIATDISAKDGRATAVITVGPDVTIVNAAELKAAFLQGLAEAEHLHVDLSPATEVDLSLLQLLCALHRAALNAEKTVTITGVDAEAVANAASAAGFIRHIGCSPEYTCMWSGGEN